MTGRARLYDAAGVLVHATRHDDDSLKAVLVDFGLDAHVWLPASQVELDPPDPAPGQAVTVTLPETLAIDKGIV